MQEFEAINWTARVVLSLEPVICKYWGSLTTTAIDRRRSSYWSMEQECSDGSRGADVTLWPNNMTGVIMHLLTSRPERNADVV